MSLKFLILMILFGTNANAAYQLSISNRKYPLGNQGPLDVIANSLESQFNTTLAASDNEGFLTQVGNANAGSTRSFLAPGIIGEARYSGSFGLSGAYSGGTNPTVKPNSLPSVGVAAQSGITIGANGEIIHLFPGLDRKKVMFHVSFYTMDLSSYFSNGITLNSMQFSTGVSYQVYNPQEWVPGIRFNGIRVSSGASYGNFSGSYTTPFTISSGGIDMKSNVKLSVDSAVYTFSNEATTGLRFLYLLDLFTGLGVDFNFGSTSLSGTNSNGAVSASQAGVSVFSGDANVTGSPYTSSPTTAQLRWFIGSQINLGPVGIYAQAQVSTPAVYSLNLGAKLSF